MKIETKPQKVYEEYTRGRSFNDAIDLYDEVDTNENMYVGKQWEGLNAPDLPKPVINVTHLVVSWAIAQIVSDNIAVSITALKKNDDISLISEALGTENARVFEINNIKQKNRMIARNGGVHGDSAMYFWFDPQEESGQKVKGEIKSEIIEGRNVHFGNPYNRNPQQQPYLILAQRKLVEEWRDEARANGRPEDEVLRIVGDENENRNEESNEFDLCTGLVKMWKKNGTVWAEIVTETATIRKPFNTGLKLYPLAWFVWEEVADQFHGRSIVTGLIQNQVAINRLYAMYIRSVEMNAFPKVVYDKQKLPDGWSNAVGKAIAATPGVEGLNAAKIAQVIRGGDVSNQVMEAIDKAIAWIKESVGATDAALGNIRPDNAQAIVAASTQAAVPMALVKLNHNDFVEQEVRIINDMMRNYYGTREVAAESFKLDDGTLLTDEVGDPVKTISYDFSKLDNPNMRLNIDIGTAAYWNEIQESTTLDNLFKNSIISARLYVESMPDNLIKNKPKIVEELKKREAAAQAAATSPIMGNTPQTPSGSFQ